MTEEVKQGESASEVKQVCCPEFKSHIWNEKEISWNGKFFVKKKLISFFKKPIGMGSSLEKINKKVESAGAKTQRPLVVIDKKGLFLANMYIEVTKPVPKCNDVKLTANFLSKVFEGEPRDIHKWIKEMKQYVKSKGKVSKRNYFYYPYCPECAKKFGKNYLVILAEI